MTSPDEANSLPNEVLEEYFTRLDHGEQPPRQEYFARYPGLQNQLRTFFENLDFVDSKVTEAQDVALTSGLGLQFASEPIANIPDNGFAEAALPLPGIRGFRLIDELGGGSQGVVYKAEQLGTKRFVALKVIREGAFATSTERRRFETEVELASRLSHPNIVSVYECGQESGRDYFAMEFVDGQSLDAYMANQPLDIPTTLDLFVRICGAVNYAHQHGVIHRDLKPSNILVDETGSPHVLDFGLAKPIPTGSSVASYALTQVGDFAGTWYYASPEQARKDPVAVDVRSDVYSLAVVLYEMLTDCLPYPVVGEAREMIAGHILQTSPTRPSMIRREIDDELETIVLCGLIKEPERRFQSAAALLTDIKRYQAGEAIEAKRDSSWYVLRKALARHRRRVALAGGALVALVAFAVTVSVLYMQAVTARATTEVRSQIVRDSQRYLLGKLDELNRLGNRYRELETARVRGTVLRPLSMPVYEEALPLLGDLVEDMPDQLFEMVLHEREPDYVTCLAWLERKTAALDEVAALSEEHRLYLGVSEPSESNFALRDREKGVGPSSQTADALCARALLANRDGRHEAAARYLETARSIALDVGDGPWPAHKMISVGIRSHTYDAVLAILSEIADGASTYTPFVAWIRRDPPLQQYRYGFLLWRLRRVQVLEAATAAAGGRYGGYVDLRALDRLTGGMYSPTGILSEETTALGRSLEPREAIAVIDSYVTEVEDWDLLSRDELMSRTESITEQLRNERAWPLVKPMLSSWTKALELKGEVRAKRALVLWAATLCSHRIQHGGWPATLALSNDKDRSLGGIDPYFGRPFTLRTDRGHLTLTLTEASGATAESAMPALHIAFVPRLE